MLKLTGRETIRVAREVTRSNTPEYLRALTHVEYQHLLERTARQLYPAKVPAPVKTKFDVLYRVNVPGVGWARSKGTVTVDRSAVLDLIAAAVAANYTDPRITAADVDVIDFTESSTR